MIQREQRLSIGEVSKRCGVSTDTVRYYERLGLLEKPPRSLGNYRLYDMRAVAKLSFIKKAQALGLGLQEIQGIIRCSKEGLGPCCDMVRKVFEVKLREFDIKIKELRRMKKGLQALLSRWVGPREARKRSFAVCPQIERD